MRGTAVRVGAPLLLGVLALAGWEVLVRGAALPAYLLPPPTEILGQIRAIWDGLVDATRATGTNALVGLVVGALLAVVTAAVAARVTWLDQMVAPLVAAAAVVPIVALAPVLSNMFGATSETPRRVIVALVVFVPVFLNTLRGLRQVSPVHRDLMRSYAATPWQVTRTVTLPGAVPFIFTGLNIASSLAVISAVVAEYFGGLQNGLGSRIASAAAQSGYARAWAYVAASIALGLLFYGFTLLLERAATRRHTG
ncbi:ABC transporter permease [Ornithinimicrobium cavernae]|uniref:ABC transporter permease n=1 Tax=Ornithinimicrobium cavernae TaxID=2666047 RepID=UPI000D68BF90|nr:ABC transporter permease subunit [Ornithinimicrobium cavernae]